jgi:GT2 family glycosyltransferase
VTGAAPLRVRAVVVTWQAAHLLPPCLDSLLRQEVTGAEVEVVVVDNASTDGTRELLGRDYPHVRVIASDRNRGFAGGVALGTAGYDGDVVLLLNNDAELADGAAQALVDGLRAPGAERIAATTARIVLAGRYRPTTTVTAGSPDGRSRWEPAVDDDPDARALVNSTGNVVGPDGAGTDRDWLVPVAEEHAPADVFGFCGGAAALRWPAAAAVGGFDEDLFLYYEDTDLSWRLRAHGWDVRYVRDAEAHHRHAASSGATSPVFRYYNSRNSLTVVTRHAPAPVVARAWLRQSAGLVRALVRDGASAQNTARTRGLRDALLRLPRTLRERRTLWRGAARGRAEALAVRSG